MERAIRKVLIANRGEIAVRVVRACAELGIRSVAIYTEPDRHALHVKQADEAYCLGPESIDAYLNIHRIVNLAIVTRCDAIHPGYGFLSENPEFAAACAKHDLLFIGPSADVIHTMGDKVAARNSMIAAGVPVVPGSEGNLANLNEALKLADQIGYPVMLKATAGGGGRGIRSCNDASELKQNYERVISEVTKAFGKPDIFLEKFICNPRHIEVQILGDHHGNHVHFFERDCSIQRRHQKLIEIAPSPQLDETQRKTVCELALKAAKHVNYQNAGTVEFLLADDGKFYFIEMNTRIQVEHTVTESITGFDLVRAQLEIASGKPLTMQQSDITHRGFAIEFRVNAEDPRNDFLPSFGKITRYYAPGGLGVRTDSAIYTGYEIPPFYDSMCAKLTVWGLDWATTIARAKRALREMKMSGVKTTIPYYLEILASKAFADAQFDTNFIQEHPEFLQYSTKAQPHHFATVIAAAILAHTEGMTGS